MKMAILVKSLDSEGVCELCFSKGFFSFAINWLGFLGISDVDFCNMKED